MPRQYREFRTEGGLVQVVEISDGECVVGYKPNATGVWVHWGLGDGGYQATVKRFEWTLKEVK